MANFIPVGIGIQTSGTDPDKHQILKLSFVSFHSGARISETLRHSDIVVDVDHCKDFLTELGEGKGIDNTAVDEVLVNFLHRESKVLFEDHPGTAIMKMVPTGRNINRTLEFIQAELPDTYKYFHSSLDLYSASILQNLRTGTDLEYLQEPIASTENKITEPTLVEAYSNCYWVAGFSNIYPDWMNK